MPKNVTKYLLKIIPFLLINVSLYAQTPKEEFAKAEGYFRTGNYSEAIEKSESVKKRLGHSNPKIEGLLFLSYFNTEEYTKSKISFETLKLMLPEEVLNSESFEVYRNTGEQLDLKLTEIQNVFEKNQDQASVSLYDTSKYEKRNGTKIKTLERLENEREARYFILQQNYEQEAIDVLAEILKSPTKQKFEDYLLIERYKTQFDDVEKYLKYWDEENYMILKYNSAEEKMGDDFESLQYHLNLTYLNISGTKIHSIPSIIFENGNLDIVAITGTSITKIPESLGKNTSMRLLYIKNNKKLNEYPKSISKFTNLQRLLLQQNHHADDIPYLGNLTKLTELYIDHVSYEIPKGILNLTNLKGLGLNNIRPPEGFALSERIAELQNLEILEFQYSSLTELPKSIGALKKLTVLNLHGTKIEDLPTELRSLKNLKEIYVGGEKYRPYSHKKVEKDLKKLRKELPSLNIKYSQ
ncbi:leucine-rich repeat domain-containing protein [Ulvibacter litoralis]|uniref:Disease resistance R13L4/SHOC-2-like LRR domain-containing protein n=1 Tax=Ulvibacter litoralis TaxID=227084 RepID=A0A1G7H0D7_9FLAO|nr:hypothetical protein [Ulvibacter litoralis]GHC59375.1 hypothetical protein GCM10008083_25270 [Ulvibacter litoralis]SDE93886.1 hypothetical protein SAMN05421855_103445 [Ulvibacter litoralis]